MPARDAPNLVSDVRPSITDVSVHLSHDTNVLVAVEQRIFLFLVRCIATRSAVGCFVRLEAGVGKDDN